MKVEGGVGRVQGHAAEQGKRYRDRVALVEYVRDDGEGAGRRDRPIAEAQR